MSLVGFSRIKKNTLDSKLQAIRESLGLINYQFDKRVADVVIKPNLCYYWDYSTGQTTDPEFVVALINLLREETSENVNISVVESDASAMKCKHAFRILGYEKLARNSDVKLINLSEDLCESAEVSAGAQSFRVKVPKTILKADLKVNVPKIKYTMRGIELTCALKNIFGCNPYSRKFKYHARLGEAIVAMNKAMRFDLSIIDGNVVSGVQPRRLGLVISSQDPVAIDVAAAEIAGLNPKTIRYLQLAGSEGLGSTRFISRGVPIVSCRRAYPRRNVRRRLMGKAQNVIRLMGLGGRLGID